MSRSWFEVDRAGLSQLLHRRSKVWLLAEILQNSLDEPSKHVNIELKSVDANSAQLIALDDAPEGWKDLTESYRLFAPSKKKSSAVARGKFGLGEKFLIAASERASICSTSGTVTFSSSGRRFTPGKRRESGTELRALLRITAEDVAEILHAAQDFLAPPGIRIVINGAVLAHRAPRKVVTCTLATELAGDDGALRPTRRQTEIEILDPLPGRAGLLYEMGLPVVETGDRYSINVLQRVPVSLERDNVTPAYLASVRAVVLEHMSATLTSDEANSTWVTDAIQTRGMSLPRAVVADVIAARFGDKAVVFDPSDHEANSRAASAGYTIVHGSQMSKEAWAVVRQAEVLQPAGRVMPTARPTFTADGRDPTVAPDKWTDAARAVVEYARRIGTRLLSAPVAVDIVSDITKPFAAWFGGNRLTFNVGRLGWAFFSGPRAKIDALIIHELGHAAASDHLSDAFHQALCDLGARLMQIALEDPDALRLDVSSATRPVADEQAA